MLSFFIFICQQSIITNITIMGNDQSVRAMTEDVEVEEVHKVKKELKKRKKKKRQKNRKGARGRRRKLRI